MEEIKPIYKFNSGMGGMICNGCRTIISTGPKTEELFCDKCKQIEHIIDMMGSDEELGLYDEKTNKCYCGHTTYCECGPEVKAYYDQMEKEVHFNRGNLNK